LSNKTSLLNLILLLVLSFNLNAAQSLQIKQAWIPEAPPGARVMAGFMEMHNSSSQSIDVIAVSSPAFSSVEMHLSKEVNGTAKMLPQKKLSIPAKGKLVLKSGSYHLMLMKPVKRLVEGEKAQLSFTLSNGEKISLNVGVKKNSSASMGSMKCGEGKCGGGKCGMGK
jgi:periplasmic copper chaperone A